MADSRSAPAGLTTAEIARRYRVGEDKVRLWITKGELRAVNTAGPLAPRPRYVVPPEALADFERSRAAAHPPKPRRRRRQAGVDFYPD